MKSMHISSHSELTGKRAYLANHTQHSRKHWESSRKQTNSKERIKANKPRYFAQAGRVRLLAEATGKAALSLERGTPIWTFQLTRKRVRVALALQLTG